MRGIQRSAGKWMCVVIAAILGIFHGGPLTAQTAADRQAPPDVAASAVPVAGNGQTGSAHQQQYAQVR
jgi:hypothetical protein